MPKRSLLTDDRLKQFKQKNAKYIISCYENEFYCENHPDEKCTRGFFSLFLQAIYGIGFAQKYELPFHVDFGNVIYAYSEREEGSGHNNFWEEFFSQPPIKNTDNLILNKQYEVYPLRVWNRKHLRYLHQLMVTGIEFNRQLKGEMDKIKLKLSKVKTLGVHFRKTDHFQEVPPASDAKFIRKIKAKISIYDQLFVATDDSELLEKLKKEFPGKIMAYDCIRSSGSRAIHHNEAQHNGLLLAKDALLDCITLSCCNELILSPSNLSYAALVFNPEVKYTIVESRAATWKRLKTLAVYQLDRLGIRKW